MKRQKQEIWSRITDKQDLRFNRFQEDIRSVRLTFSGATKRMVFDNVGIQVPPSFWPASRARFKKIVTNLIAKQLDLIGDRTEGMRRQN